MLTSPAVKDIVNRANIEPQHEQLVRNDGRNRGIVNKDKENNAISNADKKELYKQYQKKELPLDAYYIEKAIKNIEKGELGKYSFITNNCQGYTEKVTNLAYYLAKQDDKSLFRLGEKFSLKDRFIKMLP